MEWLRLIGVAVVILGFALGLRVTVVVLAAGLVTGLVAQRLDGGGSPDEVLATLGKAFVDGRIITLLVLALPAIGLLERHGLQEQARRVIRSIGAATAGRLLLVFHVFRSAVGALGIRLGSGHVIFSRPLVVPMALGAARVDEAAPEAAAEVVVDADRIKAAAAAAENYANFFAQNLFFGSPGVALVVKNLADNGYPVGALHVAELAIPMAVFALFVSAVQYALLDRWLRRRAARREASP